MGRPFNSKYHSALVSACSVTALWLASGMPAAHAAEGAVGTIMEEVEVTARKRADAEKLQEVPVAATAYSGDQLEALQTRDLQSLSFKMPNVQLDDVGTVKNTANFTVRGLGVNSSIPSIDPTVGVFVDGMYMGINAGVVTDMFDLEGIEVLRGPQGLLFGRNVTGGAVVIKTARPTDEFSSKFKLSTTDNLDTVAAASINGAISDRVNGRMTVYYNDDQGWFENVYTGNDEAGASDTWFIRPSFSVDLSESAELLVRMEHGRMDSAGVVAQNRGSLATNFPLYPLFGVDVSGWDNSDDSFEVAQNEEGYQEDEWTQAIAEYNQDVAFGNGTITNILAWREFAADGIGDIDSLPITAFHASTRVDQSQLSNELRYAGRFGATSLTTGVYWFSQDLEYYENRLLPLSGPPGSGGFDWTGGGIQDHEAMGVFAQADVDLNESWVLTLGGRYSTEEKDAKIATIPVNLCSLDGCAAYDFEDSESWSAFTPKVGLQWNLADNAQIYSFWTKGFRSGGYNMRNTGPGELPGPTDQEEQTSFEIGGKAEWFDGRLRTNMALFHNTIDDMQREENLSNPVVGVVQIIRNTADATINGAEFEAMAAATDNLLFTFNVGYVDGDYDKVKGDISGDGVVNDIDLGLDIPRLAPWTYGIGMVHDLQLGTLGTLTSRFNFNHRDAAPYTDNNLGMLSAADMLDISFGFTPDSGNYRLALFGKNMLDEVTEGNNTQLPATLGGLGASFTPLNKGRIVGVELSYDL
ncbi:iron complex outermembrane recepter protein [Microbulbifer donghaiensis]|uniref:Iron complex outermembrane recepter protein n=1 Tax=Microbulbifer donghaiensis TaxID=494016 RepID=A0A1M4X1E7_9GAMM|nr:TonB-dependent receptor [Microbulbifer donghaiensis]SHE87207.1 iron complex outermembrane recepter protein [Microbulbifer donghaiensis]